MQEKIICDKNKCTGCMACFNACKHNAIKMIADSKGFLYPQIDDSHCINCNLCAQVCPAQTELNHSSSYEQKVYAAWNLDENIRKKSSSGGIFSILADYFIEQGGIIFGAGYDKNFNVIHTCATTKTEYAHMRGSKYVQSYIGSCYTEIEKYLTQGKQVLFTGTACQVDALYHYLETRKLNKFTEQLLCIDIVCHGVPSPLIFSKYRELLEQKYGSKINNFFFRDKKVSWRDPSVTICFENGKTDTTNFQLSPYCRLFSENMILRDSCYECKYANSKRIADITLCDFWGYVPQSEMEQSHRGVSGIIVNTNKGAVTLSKIQNKCHLIPKTLNDLLPKNGPLSHPSIASSKKDEFWKDYTEQGFPFVYQKYMETSPRIVKSANYFYRNYWLLMKWFNKKQQYGSLEKSLLDKGYRRIAVYGLGEIGCKLIDDLANSSIEIVCGMDKNSTVSYRNIPTATMLPENLDAVVVTPIAEFNAIKKNLLSQTSCPIISIEELVE